MLSSCVQITQLRRDLDIDFGNYFPSAIEAYIIDIRSLDLGKLSFLLLIPEIDSDSIFVKLIDSIMFTFFKKGEKYFIRKISEDEILNYINDKYSTPILSFDPCTLFSKKISFFWLVPPLALRQ